MDERLQPVAVTGVGIVSPLGIGRQAFWDALLAGKSAVRAGDDDAGGHCVARVPDFAWRELVTSPIARRMDNLSRRFVAATRLALRDADCAPDDVAPGRLGIVAGSAYGNLDGTIEYLSKLFTKGPAMASPMLFPTLVLNAPAAHASMELGAVGSNLTVSQLEASGDLAVATGCDLIRRDRADVVIAAGGDELAKVLVDVYAGMRAIAAQRGGEAWSSPYDRDRSGIVPGEGVAALVLERPHRARARGARIFAEIVSDVSFGIPAPLYDWPDGPAWAGERLATWLAGAGVTGVDLVCGAANSSPRLDACELRLIADTLRASADAAVVTSIRGAVGEAAGGGAMSIAAACLAIAGQQVPPLCHLRQPAQGTSLRFAPRVGESRPVENVLSLALARGGAVCAHLLRKPAE